MDQPEPARGDRIPARREPGAGRAAHGQAAAADRRAAEKAGHSRQGTGTQAAGGGGYDRDAGYDLGVASEADCAEVDLSAKGSRATANGERGRAIGAYDGGGEPELGLHEPG